MVGARCDGQLVVVLWVESGWYDVVGLVWCDRCSGWSVAGMVYFLWWVVEWWVAEWWVVEW